MCLERLFVGLRAMVNATCESLATVVAVPSAPCSSTSVSDASSHTANVLSRSALLTMRQTQEYSSMALTARSRASCSDLASTRSDCSRGRPASVNVASLRQNSAEARLR